MTTSKGAQRRATLVEISRQILVAEGAERLTHRNVASRANVAPGLVSYYFPTTDDLRRAAVEALAAADLARMESVLASVEARRRSALTTARIITRVLVPAEHHELVAWYERYVSGSREPLLAGYARQVNAAARAHIATVLHRCGWPEVPAELALAVVDGAVVGALAEGARADRVHPSATRFLAVIIENVRVAYVNDADATLHRPPDRRAGRATPAAPDRPTG